MKRQIVLITHLGLLAVLMLAGCEGNNPLTPMLAADLKPTTTPISYQSTDWPTDISSLVDCDRQEGTHEACLNGYRVRLVGYLLQPRPDRVDFILVRGPLRAPVHVILPEGYSRDDLDRLCEQCAFTALEGDVTSLDPPTLMVLQKRGAVDPFNPTLPLTEMYTDTHLDITINYPASWAAEPGRDTDASAVYLQNFHNADVFEPLVGDDPSLYRVRLYPTPTEHVTALEEARAGFGPVAQEQDIEVNGLPALRLEPGGWSVMRAGVLVQLPDRVLLLSTHQDPALFDRMVETLRLLEDD